MKKITLVILMTIVLGACEQGASRSPVSNAISEGVEEAGSSLYQCPMHPNFTSSDADANCPICGMSLVAVGTDEGAQQSGTIGVSSAMIQSMGVRTAIAEVVDFGQTLRAFGSVETNERQENVTVSRLEGWIDKLIINAEGDTVRPGTMLYRVYSPDMIAAQKDYINSISVGNEKRINAVRQRLKSLGMQEQAVRALSKSQQVMERIPVYAEAGGVVARLDVREGDYVKPGTPVMRLQSYQNVWVIASIPEQDLALVSTGSEARLSFPSAPEAATVGTVDYVYPTIDVKTRTGKVRIEVGNEQGYLRPGAYADIVFSLSDQQRLSIPTESVLRDSRGNHVVLALGDGRFGSRSIETGISNGVLTEVVSGIRTGERVVVSGQFLLDSEVNLREGLSKLSGSDSSDDPSGQPDPHAGHKH